MSRTESAWALLARRTLPCGQAVTLLTAARLADAGQAVTANAVAAALSVARRTAQGNLRGLVDAGVLKRVVRAGAWHYVSD